MLTKEDGVLEISFEELDRMIGEPVYCQRCSGRGKQIVVGFLAEDGGTDVLTPAEYVDGFDDPGYHARYLPKFRGPIVPDERRRVTLRCRQCEKTCGEWTAKTIRRRLARGVVTVA